MIRRHRGFWRAWVCAGLFAAGALADAPTDAGVAPEGAARDTRVLVSPLFGGVRNELNMRNQRGEITRQTDTAPMVGLFGMVMHGPFVLTDYFFYSDVNDTDVWGNLAYLNWYGSRTARLSWNAGAGHLYHKIKPSGQDITVTVPMLKTGPLINIPEWHLSFNPYVGYAWERIETRMSKSDNDSYLYGITIGWRWRMLGATIQYYYQDSREAEDDYQTLRARAHAMVNRNWGLTVRLDYMEHATSDDTSIQFGPVVVF